MDEYKCEDCKRTFLDGFEFVDHYLEEDEDEFDPSLILPNGYHLQVGSLLRFFFDNAEEPTQIRQIAQSTYVTLFAAEQDELDSVVDMIEDMVVQSEMLRFDESLNSLLKEQEPNDEGGE
jgi:hypothetical protein